MGYLERALRKCPILKNDLLVADSNNYLHTKLFKFALVPSVYRTSAKIESLVQCMEKLGHYLGHELQESAHVWCVDFFICSLQIAYRIP